MYVCMYVRMYVYMYVCICTTYNRRGRVEACSCHGEIHIVRRVIVTILQIPVNLLVTCGSTFREATLQRRGISQTSQVSLISSLSIKKDEKLQSACGPALLPLELAAAANICVHI